MKLFTVCPPCIVALGLCIVTAASAQNFTQLATDPSGDSPGGFLDAKSLSYAIDQAKDSIWFRVESYTERPEEFGIVIGIDNDDNPTNGTLWNGSTNSSMNYERKLVASRNAIFQPEPVAYIEDPAGGPPGAANVRSVSPTVTEISCRLSDIAPNGRMNVIAGTGAFDIGGAPTLDDIPNNSYITIGSSAGIRPASPQTIAGSFFPNPIAPSGTLTVTCPAADPAGIIFSLLTVRGEEVEQGNYRLSAESGRLHIRLNDLPPGVYLGRLSLPSPGYTIPVGPFVVE
jgi:hypothetical protein